MFINRLNQVYKPKRILYYKECEEGDLPREVMKYSGAFGTYDYPGVFYLNNYGRRICGIEYRAGDDRIDYPDDLDSMVLDGAFFYSVEFDAEMKIDPESVRSMFGEIAEDDDAHRVYSDFEIPDEPELVSIFVRGDKARILYSLTLTNDSAYPIIKDDMSGIGRDRLFRMAFTDSVTGHYNWNHLVSFLEMPMDDGINDYAFVHFDIKEFRVINEVYGHIAANKVLSDIVEAMNEADFVYASARCHNDNFAMIIKDMPEQETLGRLESFFEELSHLDDDPNYKIFYRCGVVLMQRAMLSGNRVADAAKTAQAMGTNPNRTDITVYTDAKHDDIYWGNYIKAYTDTAVKNDEFLVYFQPKVDITTGRIKGSEALIRWNFRNKGLIPPSRFIPFFERDRSIGKIDDIVLHKVCAALARWKSEGRPLYPVSVNLSRIRLYNAELIDHLTAIVDSYGVDHSLIDFELTESATYDSKEHMLNALFRLREKGFLISMDDFGTGYSSLSLLTEMPVDTLKIDKSFVDKLGVDDEHEQDVIVVKSIISLAHELGFTCLAEGAEQESQIVRLRELGCDVIQGFYFSRPVPAEEYESNWLR